MIKLNVVVISVILFANLSLQAQVQPPQWQQTNGPLGGSITSIVSINDSLFTATYGAGVFISTDNGGSWSARNTGITNLFVYTLIVSGTNLFVGTNGGGIFKSSNSGMSWSAVNNGLNTWYISALTINNDSIFAGTIYGDIYLLSDNGINWNHIYTIPSNSAHINALVTDGTNLWAATDGKGLFHLTNNGIYWTGGRVSQFDSSAIITSLGIGNGILHAGVFGKGVYYCMIWSQNWSFSVTGLSNLNVECLYESGSTLYAGTNGGGVFNTESQAIVPWIEQNMGLGSLNIKCITSNGSYLYAGTNGGGIYRWTDADGSWTRVNTGLTGTNISALMVTSPGRLYAATYGCGTFVTYDSGAVWYHSTQSTDENYVYGLGFDGSYYYEGTPTGIFRSSNAVSWYNMGGSNYVLAFFADGNNLFAAAPDGVTLSTDHGISWTSANSGLGTYKVRSFAHVGSNIFAGTDGGGVFLSTNNGTSWTAVNSNLPTYGGKTYVESLVTTGSNLFAGLSGGGVFLSTNNGTSWTALNSGLTNKNITSLAISGTNMFVGTNTDGMFVSTNNGISWNSSGLTGVNVTALAVDGTNLYAGTYGLGVWRLSISQSTQNPSGWVTFNTSNGMPDQVVHSISVDTQGIGWIGTEGGLAKYDGNTWTSYTPTNSNFPGWMVYSSAIDGQGNKWIGTDHGLAKFDGSNWTNYQTSNSDLPENTVYALAIDGQGNKWVGTYSGFAKYDGANWTVYNSSNSTPDMSGMEILSLAVDGQGNKWIGTWAFGLVKFDGTNWTTYDNSNSNSPSNYVYAITPDAQGNVWIGTHLGMAKFDGINWTTYNESNSSLPNNRVHAIAIDGYGNKWIGTEGGLGKFDGVNWTMYNTTNSPLPGNLVYAITIDSHGNKWIGTDNGLSIIYGNAETELNVLIAHYPLSSNPNDTTGNFGPMVLHNTPYQQGGIYCNGVYLYDTGGCHAETPILPPSIFKSFVVTANFKVISYSSVSRPVLVGGASYRWIGFYLEPDSTVALLYNGYYTQKSTLHYSLNTWHEAKIIYDSSNTIAKLYLDEVLACSVNFTIVHGSAIDWTFGITDFGHSKTFEGVLSDLKIYSKSITSTYVQDNQNIHPDAIKLLQNYPNPFNPTTTIGYQLPKNSYVTLTVYDILGREVATLVNQQQPAGVYNVKFDAANHSSGVYFYRINVVGNDDKKFISTKKFMLLK